MEMKYVKPFELYESQVFESEIAADLQNKLKSLKPEEKEKLKSELEAFASKLDLSPEDLGDPHKVVDALSKNKDIAKIMNESEFTIGEEELFEGAWEKFKTWYQKKKTKIGEWMAKMGGLSILGGMITSGIGTELDEPARMMLRAGQTLDPNSVTVIGGIAFAVGLAAVIVGLSQAGALKAAAKAAASARSINR